MNQKIPDRERTRRSWYMMKWRCTKKSYHQYKDYGGRGITYDPRWEKFEEFLKDMGIRPEGTSLDRYPDDNGPYCKENCRWATRVEQARNRRDPLISPYPGVIWQKSKNFIAGGCWVVRIPGKRSKTKSIYHGPSVERAIEARQFYEEFILGLHNG